MGEELPQEATGDVRDHAQVGDRERRRRVAQEQVDDMVVEPRQVQGRKALGKVECEGDLPGPEWALGMQPWAR